MAKDKKRRNYTPDKDRQPLPFEAFAVEFDKRNRQLAQAGEPTLIPEEFFGARLYTGPMYMKYNIVLRGLRFEAMRAKMDELCKVSPPPTTALLRPHPEADSYRRSP